MRALAIRGCRVAVLLLMLLVPGLAPAYAHPHVWLDTRATFHLDGEGRLTAVETLWRFDEMFSALEMEGRDADGDGQISPEELAPLARDVADHLAEWRYFTILLADGGPVPLGPAEAPAMAYLDGRLEFSLRLPLAEPLPLERVRLSIFDPTFFMDMLPAEGQPVTFSGPGTAACTAVVERQGRAEPAYVPDALAADVQPETDPLKSVGARFAEWISVTCPTG